MIDTTFPDKIDVLLVGQTDRAEFCEVRRWLADNTNLIAVADPDEALTQCQQRETDPVLIVLARSWPGQFYDERLERIRRVTPLSRICEILGTWCEGETRSGHPAPGTVRHYWHQGIARIGPELAAVAEGKCPRWGLPATATDDERLMHGSTPRLRGEGGLITIHSRHAESAVALCDACSSRGYASLWIRPGQSLLLSGTRAAIWDGADCTSEAVAELTQLRRQLGDAPLVALLDFPRIEDRDRALAAGASGVVSKPFWLDDLFWQFEPKPADRRQR